ncbi:MAG: arginyltransferase [Rhodospirillales bacterium]|nr:MAG: arginyltransferase [Rhodospirillales bacterium]
MNRNPSEPWSVKHKPVAGTHFFFATAPIPCPYLPGRMERRLVAELVGPHADAFHDTLSQAGFRRSHRFAYVPVCRDCNACATVRIVVPAFQPSRTQRRVMARNRDLTGRDRAARATHEQFTLFHRYQDVRHAGGEMARMDFFDYQALVEDTPVDTRVFEFRDPAGTLIAACIADRVSDGLSAVYSYFDPRSPRSSLGTFIILWLVARARDLGLRHVYLGFWVADCGKMAYKASFQPLEAYTPEGWQPLRPDEPETTRHFRSSA